MKTPPAVLLGGGPTAVPVARSLAERDVPVYALAYGFEPVRYSRSCHEHVSFGEPRSIQAQWLEWLDGLNAHGGAILPCCDDGVELVARNRRVLVQRGYRPFEANDDVALAMLDKHRTYELARPIGIRAPRTALIGDAENCLDEAERIGFPLALKPRVAHHSAFRRRKDRPRPKAIVVADRDALKMHAEDVLKRGEDVLLTEIVPGPDDAHHSYYSYVDEDGTPLFQFTKRKLRQYPPGFGLATYHVTDRNPEVLEHGARFFREIGLRGLACVEFKRDARDGGLTLIECNHRFTAGTELVQRAGIDLAWLVYGRLAGLPVPALNGYRTGLHMWHPIEDTLTLGLLRRCGELTVRAWAHSLFHPQRFPLFRWSDPLPSIASSIRMLSVAPGFVVESVKNRQARPTARADD